MYAATGSVMDTSLLMGAPEWFGLAVPTLSPVGYVFHGRCSSSGHRVFVLPRAAGSSPRSYFHHGNRYDRVTAYSLHIILRGLWPSNWAEPLAVGDPAWADVVMLLVHWGIVIALGVVPLFGVRDR